jgi:hypothetical protein
VHSWEGCKWKAPVLAVAGHGVDCPLRHSSRSSAAAGQLVRRGIQRLVGCVSSAAAGWLAGSGCGCSLAAAGLLWMVHCSQCTRGRRGSGWGPTTPRCSAVAGSRTSFHSGMHAAHRGWLELLLRAVGPGNAAACMAAVEHLAAGGSSWELLSSCWLASLHLAAAGRLLSLGGCRRQPLRAPPRGGVAPREL